METPKSGGRDPQRLLPRSTLTSHAHSRILVLAHLLLRFHGIQTPTLERVVIMQLPLSEGSPLV